MKKSSIEKAPEVAVQNNPLFRTKYPRKVNDQQGSNTYGVSKTIPNETYTIRELLNKHTSGIMPRVENDPIWQEDASHDSVDLQKLHRSDIVEKQIEKTRQTNIIQQLDEIIQQKRAMLEQDEQQQRAKAQSLTSESEAKAQKGTAPSE